ncbi:MAG: DUF2283 domain-containing protein [Bryobacteraceae bacterium]
MRITYDPFADAAYIYLVDSISPGGVNWTEPGDPAGIASGVNLDFDVQGRLLGIEVLDASKTLPQSVLDRAERFEQPPVEVLREGKH